MIHSRNTAMHDRLTPDAMVAEAQACAAANLREAERASFVVGFLTSVLTAQCLAYQHLLTSDRALRHEHNALVMVVTELAKGNPALDTAIQFARVWPVDDLPVPVAELVPER